MFNPFPSTNDINISMIILVFIQFSKKFVGQCLSSMHVIDVTHEINDLCESCFSPGSFYLYIILSFHQCFILGSI